MWLRLTFRGESTRCASGIMSMARGVAMPMSTYGPCPCHRHGPRQWHCHAQDRPKTTRGLALTRAIAWQDSAKYWQCPACHWPKDWQANSAKWRRGDKALGRQLLSATRQTLNWLLRLKVRTDAQPTAQTPKSQRSHVKWDAQTVC